MYFLEVNYLGIVMIVAALRDLVRIFKSRRNFILSGEFTSNEGRITRAKVPSSSDWSYAEYRSINACISNLSS